MLLSKREGKGKGKGRGRGRGRSSCKRERKCPKTYRVYIEKWDLCNFCRIFWQDFLYETLGPE
jgi:hypothetical protein